MALFDQFTAAQLGNGISAPNPQATAGAPGYGIGTWGNIPPGLAGGLQSFVNRGTQTMNPFMQPPGAPAGVPPGNVMGGGGGMPPGGIFTPPPSPVTFGATQVPPDALAGAQHGIPAPYAGASVLPPSGTLSSATPIMTAPQGTAAPTLAGGLNPYLRR
jgi:hypothetical protein